MRFHPRTSLLCLAAVFAAGVGTTAHATPVTIDFESQAAGAPSTFNYTLDSPLTIGTATFTGGQLLNKENGGADQTGVYATVGPVVPAYPSSLNIAFSSGVSDFSLFLTNNTANTFTVSDNVGDSQTVFVTYNGNYTFNLAGSGITSVTITPLNLSFWDYAIDNVNFNTANAAATPEPSSLWLLGTGVVGAAGALRRRVLRTS